MHQGSLTRAIFVVGSVLMCAAASMARQSQAVPSYPQANSAAPKPDPTRSPTPPGNSPPSDYHIGPEDVLSIVFWRDKDMSADVTVRPDGKILLPLLNEIQAEGYTPEQLRAKILEAAGNYIENPNATVIVKEIHSRNVFITGNVVKPNAYQLATGMTVMQLIALAGGLLEYADSK